MHNWPCNWDDLAAEIRRQTRWRIAARGIAWTVCSLLGLVCAALTVDVLVHLDSRIVRVLLLTTIAIISGVTAWRTLLVPLLTRLTEVEIARIIERRTPEWGESLSSAAQFRRELNQAEHADDTLRQEVVRQADSRLNSIDTGSLFASGGQRPLWLTGAACLLAGAGFAGTDRAISTIALCRVLLPWSDISYPRTTQLRLLGEDRQPLGPNRVRTARGREFVVYVENALGPLPPDARLELQSSSGAVEQRPLRAARIRGTTGQTREIGVDAFVVRGEQLRLRAVGGDDEGTPWQTLEVVSAPAVTDLRLTAIPPAYTGRIESSPTAGGPLKLLVGTELLFDAAVNKPLASATLEWEGDGVTATAAPLELRGKGRGVTGRFLLHEAGTARFWLALTDRDGLTDEHPPRYELQVHADRKPTAFLEVPAHDLTVTPAASLPLRIVAQDDLGLAHVDLRYTIEPGDPADVRQSSLPLSSPLPTDEIIDTLWDLSELNLTAGARVAFWAEARDAFRPLSPASSPPGQMGSSSHRHLWVVSAADKRRELATRQSDLLKAVENLRDREGQARATTALLAIQAEIAGRLRDEDFESLKLNEIVQQRLREELADDRTGVVSDVQRLRREFAANRLEDFEALDRLDQLAARLQDLADRVLPQIEQSLARARKSAEREASGSRDTAPVPPESSAEIAGRPVDEYLRDAELAQSEAVRRLAEVVASLGGWQELFELSSEVQQLLADQRSVHDDTRTTGPALLAKSLSQLEPQQRADLEQLSERQRTLARRLEEVLATSLPAQPDQAAAPDRPVGDSVRRLAERDTVRQMHGAAESLKRNELLEAARTQEEILAALAEFGQLMHTAPQRDPAEELAELERAAQQVEALSERQQQLSDSTQRTLGPDGAQDLQAARTHLQEQQTQVADQTGELSRNLQSLSDPRPSSTAARAQRRMRDAADALPTTDRAALGTLHAEAQADLQQLADELGRLRQSVGAQLASDRLETLAAQLQDAADRQHQLKDDTVSLNEQVQARGSWGRTQLKALRDLTQQQRDLTATVHDHIVPFRESAVIAAALTRVVRAMQRGGDLLDERETGELAQAHFDQAESRLRTIVATIRPEHSSDEPPMSPDPARPPSEPRGPAGPALVVQLRLLRQMQADVTAATEALQRRDADPGAPTPAADPTALRTDAGELAEDQARLTELLENLLAQLPTSIPAPVPSPGAPAPPVMEELP